LPGNGAAHCALTDHDDIEMQSSTFGDDAGQAFGPKLFAKPCGVR
jgi:hypothetical protein